PWDKEWLVEPLSDSTIYMAYYTIAHRLKEIDPGLLEPEVFDYLFTGKGSPTSLPKETLDALRTEFLYWYPYDFRFSAKDLISNHLTFQLFHHAAIFPRDLYPRGMVVFGMGLLEGAKMSSSKGNVVLLEDALDEFGTDTVRMFLVGSAEPWQDFDWRNEFVVSTKKQIERFAGTVEEGLSASGTDPIDRWLSSRVQMRISSTTAALESFQTRQAIQEAYFGIEGDLKWYRRRLPKGVMATGAMRELCHTWVRLLAPFVPVTSGRLWEQLGGEGAVAFAPWPTVDEVRINRDAELAEELLQRTVEDIESILKLIQITPAKIQLFVAPAWKWEIFRTVAGAGDRTAVMKEVMRDEEMRKKGKVVADTIKQVTNLIHRLPPQLVERLKERGVNEAKIFQEAALFFTKEFGVPVEVVDAEGRAHPKAASSLPFKPAIVIE
ncbi:MAG: class I tRNA ligase family protein, partial [Methanomicrobiaceae archaeon]|nr:class I tRNA ligase family protein [Methanomicrobiaceae archaeon]